MKKQTLEKKVEFDYTTIKSFEDACKSANIDPEALPEVSSIPEEFRKAIINVYKLFIIFQAINNGWQPNWNNSSEYKYFPWLWVDASKELSSGFGFSDTDYYFTYAHTLVGSRLCTDTSDKALYIANTFQEEYKEFFLIRK